MQLTTNFTLEELIHSDTANAKGIDNTPTKEIEENLKYLAEKALQPIRDKWGKPLTVNSGYRCKELNKAVGGVSNSSHLTGLAADIEAGTNEDNKKLFNFISEMVKNKEITVDQVIDEKNYAWIHVGISRENNRNEVFHL